MSGTPDLIRLCVNHFFSHFLAFIIAAFALWNISYQFSILLGIWIIVFIVGTTLFARRAKKLCATSAEVRSVFMGKVVDILTNIFNIHLFSGKKHEAKDLRLQLDAYVKADQRRDWWFLWMYFFQGFSFVVYQTIGFVLLVQGFKNGVVTAGDFVLLISINIAIIECLWSFSADVATFSELVGSITQGLRRVLEPFDIQDKHNAKQLQITQGRIVFDSVQFHYKGTEPIFSDKSVIIEAGQKVGLVGYSGSGKSTFVNLILRLYDVTGGRILIDGQDITGVIQDSLHDKIGMIPQEPSLFHRSIMENIRYGRMDATDEEVIQAAEQAHAHEFISKLPQGYHSFVGERGVKLSGGQRQRIAIARAVLKNAPILILDEATSQLDSVTETYIQDSLWDLMQNKTTLVVAHRLSTLLHMDRILVFDQGRIVEEGSHNELLAKAGLYKTLWDAQVGGFLYDERSEEKFI
jgi:ATP-binding cassette subfamily B protein